MEVQSEISPGFETADSIPVINPKNAMSRFEVKYPGHTVTRDCDGDYIVSRKSSGSDYTFVIEHSVSTSLKLVGQQLWRGALLLADLMTHLRDELAGETVLELGAGVGLTSLVAALYARRVVSTDLDVGDILPLLRENIRRNEILLKAETAVLGLDWFNTDWSAELRDEIGKATIIIAADVVYDNSLTEAFVRTITKILSTPPRKTLYIALEKRYVFTIEDLDTCAPCYEHLLACLRGAQARPPWSQWTIASVSIDFPQVLQYPRTKHLVLWKISS